MKKKTLFLFLCATSASVISTMIGLTSKDLYGVAYNVNEDGTISMNFDGGNNTLNQSSDIDNGFANLHTLAGNEIGFTYKGLIHQGSNWQVIKPNGYFYNEKAITGLASIMITTSKPLSLSLSYGYNASSYFVSDYTLNSGVAYEFENKHPNFFELKNTSSSDIAIEKIEVRYTCKAIEEDVTLQNKIFTSEDKLYQYKKVGGGASLYKYLGENNGLVIVPDTIDGINVTSIEPNCFIKEEAKPLALRGLNEDVNTSNNTKAAYFIPHTIDDIKNGAFAENSIFTTDNTDLPEGWVDQAIKNSADTVSNIVFNIKPNYLVIDNGLIFVRDDTTYSCDLIASFNMNKKIIIPDKVMIPETKEERPVSNIRGNGFSYSYNLEELVLPKDLVRIYENTISYCPNLKRIGFEQIDKNLEQVRIDTSTLPNLEDMVMPFGFDQIIKPDNALKMKKMSCKLSDFNLIKDNTSLTDLFIDGKKAYFDDMFNNNYNKTDFKFLSNPNLKITFRLRDSVDIKTKAEFDALKPGDVFHSSLIKRYEVWKDEFYTFEGDENSGCILRHINDNDSLAIDHKYVSWDCVVSYYAGNKVFSNMAMSMIDEGYVENNITFTNISDPTTILAPNANNFSKFFQTTLTVGEYNDYNYHFVDQNNNLIPNLNLWYGHINKTIFVTDTIQVLATVMHYGNKVELEVFSFKFVEYLQPIKVNSLKELKQHNMPGRLFEIDAYFPTKNILIDQFGDSYYVKPNKKVNTVNGKVNSVVVYYEVIGSESINPRTIMYIRRMTGTTDLPIPDVEYPYASISQIVANKYYAQQNLYTFIGIAETDLTLDSYGNYYYEFSFIDPLTGTKIGCYYRGDGTDIAHFKAGDKLKIQGVIYFYERIVQVSPYNIQFA